MKWMYDKIYRGEAGVEKAGKALDENQRKRIVHAYGRMTEKSMGLAMDIVDAMEPSSILDVGCGQNIFVREIRKRSNTFAIGVDFSSPKADVNADIVDLPYCDKWFDLITAFDVMEHIEEHKIDAALCEMARVPHRFAMVICCRHATYSVDGVNAHATIKKPKWWMDKISKYSDSVKYKEFKANKKLLATGEWKH